MTPWTLDELTRRVNGVLQRELVRQDNGQVAEAPNARAIRWYQSTGLLRRPEQRGRVAFYGPAHLIELVAIKRLQALGLSLAEVQQRLVGASDDRVAAIAALPADLEPTAVTVTVNPDSDDRAAGGFWADEIADAPIVVAPAALGARAAIDVGGATLVLPTGCTAPPDLVSALLVTLLHHLAEAGPLPSTSPRVAPDATTKESP